MPKLYEATFEIPTYRTIKIALPGRDPKREVWAAFKQWRLDDGSVFAAAWENAVADCDGRCDLVDIHEIETEAA